MHKNVRTHTCKHTAVCSIPSGPLVKWAQERQPRWLISPLCLRINECVIEFWLRLTLMFLNEKNKYALSELVSVFAFLVCQAASCTPAYKSLCSSVHISFFLCLEASVWSWLDREGLLAYSIRCHSRRRWVRRMLFLKLTLGGLLQSQQRGIRKRQSDQLSQKTSRPSSPICWQVPVSILRKENYRSWCEIFTQLHSAKNLTGYVLYFTRCLLLSKTTRPGGLKREKH